MNKAAPQLEYVQYRSVFENNPLMQIIIDRNHLSIIDANKAARVFFQHSTDNLLGKSIECIFSQEKAAILNHIANMEKGVNQDLIIWYQKKNNKYAFSIKMSFNLQDEGPYILLCFTDITKYLNENTRLKERGQKLKIVFKDLDVIIFQLNKDGIILMAEGRGLDKINLKAEQMIGFSLFDIYEKFPEITDSIKSVLKGNEVRKSLEVRGNVYDVIFTPVKDEKGEVTGLIGLATDITERKRTEEALILSEAKYRMLVENTSDIMFVFDNQGVFTYISSSVNRFGYDVNEIIGRKVSDFIHEDDKVFTEAEIKKTLMGLIGNAPRTFRIMLKDGSYIIVEEVGKVIRDENGQIIQLIGILRDVTQRKLAEEGLRKSEERYRLLVELMPESVIILQEDTIVFANNAFSQLCNVIHPQDVVGENMSKFIHPDYIAGLVNLTTNVLSNKLKCLSGESRVFISEHKIVDVEITGSYFSYLDKPAVLLILRDLSERKRNMELIEKIEQNSLLLREAQEYDKLKTEFFANISHEFKTPISVILGTLQLMNLLLKMNENSQDVAKKFDRYFYIMKQNCYRLLRLVNNLIDITRIDSNFYLIQLQNKNIVNIIENIVLSISEYVENKGLTLQLIKEDDKIMIACDPDKIERIMLNLISNAIKFTSFGGKITIKVKRTKDSVEISVIDTGIGIPPDKLHIIFERFRQIDRSLTRNHEGSGIGLSLVKSLVEMHKGSISVKSKYEKGSKFIIHLPLEKVSKEEDNAAQHEERIKEMQVERINIEFSDIYLK